MNIIDLNLQQASELVEQLTMAITAIAAKKDSLPDAYQYIAGLGTNERYRIRVGN